MHRASTKQSNDYGNQIGSRTGKGSIYNQVFVSRQGYFFRPDKQRNQK
jgi:hypothetical protein